MTVNYNTYTKGFFMNRRTFRFTLMELLTVVAIIGILAFSRFLHWLLARWQKETMIVLAGFIIGSLVKIWPWSNSEAIVLSQFPELASFGDALPTEIISQYMASADLHIGGAVLFAAIGFSLVTGIEMAGKVASRKKTA